MEREQAINEAVKAIIEDPTINIDKLKRAVCKKHNLSVYLRNSDILKLFPKDKLTDIIKRKLMKVPTRTLSGVTPVAVMTFSGCPHSGCIYCPRGKDAAQSYTGHEPAAMRAKQNHFDPWDQVKSRLRQYEEIGHPTDKCELILMGGTFLSEKEEYKHHFVKRCYEAFNDQESNCLEDAKKVNETAKHRIVGLTIETRPDWAKEKHVKEMLSYGCTRVELGVQTLSDSIYEKVNRGHTVQDVIEATTTCRNAGLKIVFHMMPGLFQNKEQDIKTFKQLFNDSQFRPDMLKIYPTMVMANTKLYDMWEQGNFKPYSAEEAADVISEIYREIPKYVRVMRIQRDIPTPLVIDGVKKSNLRQLVEQQCNIKKIKINEIRAREIGISQRDNKTNSEMKNSEMKNSEMKNSEMKNSKMKNSEMKLNIIKYEANEGQEYFISFEDNNERLAGFIRLRLCDKAIVRELHVYGSEVKLGEQGTTQHQGYGKKLLDKAEQICKEHEFKELYIIAGVGVRQYYYGLGYKPALPYVMKRLD